MNADKTIYCFKLKKLISKLHDNTLKSKFQIKKLKQLISERKIKEFEDESLEKLAKKDNSIEERNKNILTGNKY